MNFDKELTKFSKPYRTEKTRESEHRMKKTEDWRTNRESQFKKNNQASLLT